MPATNDVPSPSCLAACEDHDDGGRTCWHVQSDVPMMLGMVRVRVLHRTPSGDFRAYEVLSMGADPALVADVVVTGARSGPGWAAVEVSPGDAHAAMTEVIERDWPLRGLGSGGRDVVSRTHVPEQVPLVLMTGLMRLCPDDALAGSRDVTEGESLAA